MTATDIASSNLYYPGGIPCRLISHKENSTGNTTTVKPSLSNVGAVLVLGFDAVASGSEPIQCFIDFQIPTGFQVFYDSQSTGEGNGVRFTWRGQAPLMFDEQLSTTYSSSGAIEWTVNAWGLALPFDCIVA
jgi:hypothetical protein